MLSLSVTKVWSFAESRMREVIRYISIKGMLLHQ